MAAAHNAAMQGLLTGLTQAMQAGLANVAGNQGGGKIVSNLQGMTFKGTSTEDGDRFIDQFTKLNYG